MTVAALEDVWLLPPDGTWTRVPARDVSATSNLWGADTLSFVAPRDARAIRDDLVADARVELRVGGQRCWAGRVSEVAASGPRQLAVTCTGWQYHLDDVPIDRVYAHTDMGAWKPLRDYLAADLTVYRAGSICEASGGAIRLGWPSGYAVTTGQRSGVLLDLGDGPSLDLQRIAATWARVGTAFGARLRAAIVDYTSTTDSAIFTGLGHLESQTFTTIGGVQVIDVDLSATASGTLTTGTAGPYAGRYAVVYVEWTAAGATLTEDKLVQVSDLRAYGSSAATYFNAAATTLTASTVILDALAQACAALSTDQRRVAATSFVIPHFSTEGYRSPREIVDAVTLYDDARFAVDNYLRPVLEARPAAPTISVGRDCQWEDAAIARSDDVVGMVIGEATSPSGAQIREHRSVGVAGLQQRSALRLLATQWANRDFEAGTLTNWVAVSGGAATRSTAQFDSGAASMLLTGDASGNSSVKTTSTVTLRAGRSYRIVCRVRRDALNTAGTLRLEIGHDANPASGAALRRIIRRHDVALTTLTAGAWATVTADLVAPIACAATLTVSAVSAAPISAAILHIDNVALHERVDTATERSGFGRGRVVQTGASTTHTGLRKLTDLYAYGRSRAPARGTLTVPGAAAWRLPAACRVAAHELLDCTWQTVALRDVRDPYTGALGRVGTIVAVEYRDGTARVTVDQESDAVDAVLARVGLLTGLVRT